MLDLIMLLVFTFFFIPLFTLFHELGHALFAFIVTDKKITISLGTKPSLWTFHIGRFTFNLHLNGGWIGFYSIHGEGKSLTPINSILVSFGGPLITLILAVFSGVFYMTWDYPGILRGLARASLIFTTLQFFVTIIPFRYPAGFGAYAGMRSDGYTIFNTLFKKSDIKRKN